MTENITTCLNGELKPGDLVLSTPDDEYGLLVGTVLAVNKVGSPEHESETQNETDAVHVNFMALRYSDRRLREIDMMLSELYGENRSLLAAPLDDAIMAPDALIRIDGIDARDLDAILSSEEKAVAYCEKVLTGLEAAQVPMLATEKLYSPLKFYLRDSDTALAGGYDENEYWRDELTHTEALRFIDNLELFLRRDRDYYNTERGLMEYYHGPESVNGKVISLLPAIELHEGRLWCAANMKLREPLTAEEMTALKDYWSGQLSDGVGESWEQEAIKVPGGELYMEPWTSDDSFFIDTEKEFRRRLAPEPDHALIKQLWEKTERNFADFEREILAKSKHEIFSDAERIAAMDNARFYLAEYAHEFPAGVIKELLTLYDPVKAVAYAWQQHTDDLSDMDDLIREVASGADIAKSNREPDRVGARVAQSFTSGEKPSVITQIHRARDEARENPVPRESIPGRNHEPGR
jgi:hypothetical protein